MAKKYLRESLGLRDDDKPMEYGTKSIGDQCYYIYELILENQLTEEEITIFRAVKKAGLYYIEIARILNISERTAQRKVEKAIKKFQNIVKYLDFNKVRNEMIKEMQKEKKLREDENKDEPSLF